MRNKPAVIGMVFIFFSVIIAVLGYLITPDSTPDANDQVLQIRDKQPGFTIKMLLPSKNKSIEPSNFFVTMLYGRENPFDNIPINSYRFEGSDIVFEAYKGEGRSETDRLPLADVAYALSVNNPEISTERNTITFYDYAGQKITKTVSELQQEVEKNNIVTRKYYLGTDGHGRDMLSRLILGVRVSLSVGVIAVFISIFIGVLIGAAAGFFRGWVDDLCMYIINVIWPIPTLLLVFAITLVLDKGFWQIFIAVGLTMWVEAARIIRGQVLSLREMLYIEAARSLGYSNLRTIALHILPNVFGPLMVIAAANFASAIIIEAGLSYLGVGVSPPTPTWGGMLSENYGYILGSTAFLAIIPGVAIMLMVLAFNVVGNGLRDALDVRTSLGSEK